MTNPKLFDAAENIEKNILLLEGLSGQKKVTIAWDRKKPLQVWADPDHVDFIFRNLLSNAVKFSFPGGVIHLMTETDDTVIRFTVEDEGVGMPQEKIRLFETDDLSSSYGTGGEKGSGLGLQVVRKFITANNGHIHLSSQENKGTTVSFTLPKLPLHG